MNLLRSRRFAAGLTFAFVLAFTASTFAANNRSKSGIPSIPAKFKAVAADVDHLILMDLKKGGVKPAEGCNDADFLRRVTLDITGQLPSPRDVTIFSLDPATDKREILIEQLLRSPEYGKNWARYWRDVVYMPATENRARIAQTDFETWMADKLNSGTGWDQIVTAMLTATGNTANGTNGV